MEKKELILNLFEIGAIKFGEFTLKTGIVSPIYIDLRTTVSYPKILEAIADAMWEEIKNLNFDIVCGVPYTALPIATVISLKHNKPMVMRRKEVKDYGTKKIIEGVFTPSQECLVIEDLVTSGSSVFETIEPLEHEGLKVKDIVVLLNREQGGKENISQKGYNLYAVMTITEVLDTLFAEGKTDMTTIEKVKQFIQQNQVQPTQK